MGNNSIFEQIIDFISELAQSLSDGYLFFGSAWDLVRYAADIILVAVLFYWILRFLRQTRAWQLIKGVVLIILFVVLCGVMGLEVINFLFNKLLYVLAFLFIVIFQPELRRALETVGLKTFGSFKSLFSGATVEESAQVSSLVHEISLACMDMASTYTGALILIERTTRLNELLTQENVVKFDSTVTTSVLQSIFYKGSPMHDGGLLIRDGRIVAARCHVPLSVTMHNLERTGTRHRAAVGASEMGDTIVVVVSEERGTTSIAVNGRLYEMNDIQELEANLSYLLGAAGTKPKKKGIGRIINDIRERRNRKVRPAGNVAAAKPITAAEGESSVPDMVIKTQDAEQAGNSVQLSIPEHALIIVLSIVMSLGLWIYIQINNNPVVTASFKVPITYNDVSIPENMDVSSYPIDIVEVEIVGRQSTISSITAEDIIATIDYSEISEAGVMELPINVESSDRSIYFRVERQVPETISVTVYAVNDSQEGTEE